jgi:ADP-ribose pyrophosphatase
MDIPPADGTTELARGRHLRFVRRNGWEYVERPGVTGIVVIVGMTPHGHAVLVTQWREPVGARVVEWPAGLAGDHRGVSGEDLATAARRELLEETGFLADALEPVLSGPPSPGISSEVVTLFRARGLRRVGAGGGVENERVRTHVVPLPRLEEWMARIQSLGAMVDPKVLAGACLLRSGQVERNT